MKRVLIPALTSLLIGCATTSSTDGAPGAEWVAGTWLMMESMEDRDLGGCASGLPVRYRSDGTYTVFEGEEGVWRIEGDRLTETATEAHENIDPGEVAIGRPFVSRVQRLSRDEMLKTFADGTRALFRRCPPHP